ncbi:MAG: CBS domain-containing protein [Dissulfurispiraceae bacterium]
MTVKELLEKKGMGAFAIEGSRTVDDAIRLLSENKISAIMVNDQGRTVGIFTERDVLRCYLTTGGKPFNEVLLTDAMTRDLIVAEPEDEMCDIMSVMIEKSVRHLPVTDGMRIIGMLSIRDIVKAQIKELHARIHYLKDYVSGIHGTHWI